MRLSGISIISLVTVEPLATLTSKMNSGKAEHFKTGGCGLKPGRKKTGREFNQKLPGKSRCVSIC